MANKSHAWNAIESVWGIVAGESNGSLETRGANRAGLCWEAIEAPFLIGQTEMGIHIGTRLTVFAVDPVRS
jgi:hypothetical protein